jgi:hypothetical protein
MSTIARVTLPLLLLVALCAHAAQVRLLWPLERSCYQTNEWIDLSVVRSDANALAAGTLIVTVTGKDGGGVATNFAVPAVPVVDGTATATEHLHLNGRLLRPGAYAVHVACDGATADGAFELFSHLRLSTFKIVDWNHGSPTGRPQQLMGEDGMGYNVTYSQGNGDASIRGGLDYMRGMALGGAHQLDANLKNDWSDPWVLREGRLRASREALKDRTSPNCLGVHFYDEPGLTWNEHPVTKEFNPYNIAAQDRAWKAMYGTDAQQYHTVKDDPAAMARWRELNTWKQGFMEACWKEVSSGVRKVKPDWLTATQTMYGWDAFSDGYYFNIARQLPVINGHGWYSDVYWLNLAPPMASEFGRMRDWSRPCWYMPTWWTMNIAHTRMEQSMSFIQNLQGMMWPGYQAWSPSRDPGMPGVVEDNKTQLRLGTIFQHMPVYRDHAAILYSLSQGIESEIRSGMKDIREANSHMRTTEAFYAAGMRNQTPLIPVVEEDILDGTLALHHKVLILSKVEYLDPKVIGALEAYIAAGGVVLTDVECTVAIKGVTKLGLGMDYTFHKAIESRDRGIYTSINFMKNVEPLAKALREKLAAYGVQPVFGCDSLDILGRKQADGDVEYLFAVNMRCDPDIQWQNTVRGTTATISVPADGRPVYDALLGGPAPFAKKGNTLAAPLRFGPGQMRAFARTARPIAGVTVYPPRVVRNYVDRPEAPFTMEIQAAVVDAQGQPLRGALPLSVRVVDPLGDVRHRLYRATNAGLLTLTVPLAANDPAGAWTVEVTDLLANTIGRATVTLTQPTIAGALAGTTRRAVLFGDDTEHCYQFVKAHRRVTLVVGTAPYEREEAERLAAALADWRVACTVVTAAEVKPAVRGPWADKIGLSWSPGYDLADACIVLGNPDDNPLIKMLFTKAGGPMTHGPATVMPYAPTKDVFPGRGRGYVAWQIDALGHDVESITCIAYDALGMREAVGTFFEAASGITPLTPWTLPTSCRVTPAAVKGQTLPAPATAWTAQVPDRAIGMAALADGRVAVASYDGTLTLFDAAGKTLWTRTTERSGETMVFAASPDGHTLAISGGSFVTAFDDKGKVLFDERAFPDARMVFVNALTISPDGNTVYAATGDAGVVSLTRAGKRQWFVTEPGWGAYQASERAYQVALKAWEAKKNNPDPKPTPPTPRRADAYQAVAVSADGATVLAVSGSTGHLFAAKDGAFLGAVGGLNGRYPLLVDGNDFLATDGNNAIKRVSAAEKKVTVTYPTAAIPVALTRAGDGWLIGTESDGGVRRLAALGVKTATWEDQARTRIVKYVLPVGEKTAVIYWGGAVRLFDAAGEPVADTLYTQDFSAAVSTGTTLVGTLADGRVVAIR